MEFTRVDTKKLKAAVEKAVSHIAQAKEVMAPYLDVITDAQRTSMAHPPAKFPTAGRTLARAATAHPEVAAVSEFDSEAVVEDLDNADALAPLDEAVAELARLAADTRLVWLSEAWVPSLALYAIAKVKAKTNAALDTIVQPLAEVFATPRRRK